MSSIDKRHCLRKITSSKVYSYTFFNSQVVTHQIQAESLQATVQPLSIKNRCWRESLLFFTKLGASSCQESTQLPSQHAIPTLPLLLTSSLFSKLFLNCINSSESKHIRHTSTILCPLGIRFQSSRNKRRAQLYIQIKISLQTNKTLFSDRIT